MSLVSLGNVLHQSLRSEDAAAVLEMAVNTDPSNVVSHYTLGNVYAVLMQYNKSVESFDRAVTILDDLDWVKKRKAAVQVSTLSIDTFNVSIFNTFLNCVLFSVIASWRWHWRLSIPNSSGRWRS